MSYEEDLARAVELLSTMEQHQKFNKLDYFKPYDPQLKFFTYGVDYRERLFRAGNRVGKSEGGAVETALHLTGRYPDWWSGARYEHPIKAWAAGVSSLAVRDVAQTKLCGQYGQVAAFGTGYIPKEDFADKPTLSRGVSDAFDTIQVVHHNKYGVADGVSQLAFKSYEQGREKFQGEDLDFGWSDEEPPMDIYSEFLTRVNGPGRMIATLTPLYGATDLMKYFRDDTSGTRITVNMSLYDAKHFTAKEIEEKIAGYPIHERDARVYGVPMLGSGSIFPYSEDMIREKYLTYVPPSWAKIWGLDFGIAHAFAAVLLLWDRDNDVVHVHHAIRMQSDARVPQNSQPLFQATAMKQYGASVPVAWPHDGHTRDKGSGDQLQTIYKKHGLLMLPTHATWPEGGFGTEAGITEISDRIITGRFKVAEHLSDWFEEYRSYHRDKTGQIFKKDDDLMSATRIALMQKRSAQPVPLGKQVVKRRRDAGIAQGVDFDVFAT